MERLKIQDSEAIKASRPLVTLHLLTFLFTGDGGGVNGLHGALRYSNVLIAITMTSKCPQQAIAEILKCGRNFLSLHFVL